VCNGGGGLRRNRTTETAFKLSELSVAKMFLDIVVRFRHLVSRLCIALYAISEISRVSTHIYV
jgi:hypothetical protein